MYRIAIILLLFAYKSAFGQFSFTEISDSVGLTYFGDSWGAAWGDANGDEWPDLFTSNHFRKERAESKPPSVYINRGGARFDEVVLSEMTIDGNDFHGAAWIDINRDGKQELFVTSGRNQAVWALYNTDGESFLPFEDKVGNGAPGRSRQVVLWDINADGVTELFIPTEKPFNPLQQYNSFYGRDRKEFTNINALLGFTETRSSNLAVLMDHNADRKLELVASLERRIVELFDNTTIPFTNKLLWNEPIVSDLVPADLNGDLQTDLLIVRADRAPNAGMENDSVLSFSLAPDGNEQGIRFKASVPFQLKFYHGTKGAFSLKVGSGANFVDSAYFDYTFTYEQANYTGPVVSHLPGIDIGTYLGYDSIANEWTLLRSLPTKETGFFGKIQAGPGGQLELVEKIALPDLYPQYNDFLYNAGGNFTDFTNFANPDSIRGSLAAVTGDFDNDMDLDIYLLRGGGFPRFANLFYENDGNGRFEIHEHAFSATQKFGYSDAVTTVDFNNDGMLDIFVTDGGGFFGGGPDQLYRNDGNDNNFLAVKLQGSSSNLEAIGAVAILYAGGVAQLREQNGGAHLYSQNHMRLHFGLGNNNVADSLVIFWPDGNQQVVYGLPANQFFTITEAVLTARSAPLSPQELSGVHFDFQLYPNPVTELLQLEIHRQNPVNEPKKSATALSIVITDLQGKSLYREETFVELGEQSIQIDIAEFPPGNYLLSLFHDGKISSRSFVKE